MFRVLDIYIIQDFSLWFYYFLGVAFNFTMNLIENDRQDLLNSYGKFAIIDMICVLV